VECRCHAGYGLGQSTCESRKGFEAVEDGRCGEVFVIAPCVSRGDLRAQTGDHHGLGRSDDHAMDFESGMQLELLPTTSRVPHLKFLDSCLSSGYLKQSEYSIYLTGVDPFSPQLVVSVYRGRDSCMKLSTQTLNPTTCTF